MAGAVFGLLAVAVTLVAAAGVAAAPLLVDVLVPGFDQARRDLAIVLIRVMFPGVALLVLSSWCLGVLNSHRRFLLSYAAPAGWNAAIIVTTVVAARAGGGDDRLVVWTAWGAVIGSAVQLLIQLPWAWRLAGAPPISLGRGVRAVRTVATNFLPAATSRGVVQIGAFADAFLASWLPRGAVTALTNAQLLYTLPVSLFGMSIAASELPALSEAAEREGGAGPGSALRERLERAARHLAFFVVPSAVGFIVLGKSMAALVLQSGEFTAADSTWVWGTLAGSSIGLLAATLGRLYSSAFFALGDTKTPLRFAALRVGAGIGLGAAAALLGPGLLGIDPRWGTAGLAGAAGVVAWLECLLLRRALTARIGPLTTDRSHLARVWIAALGAAAVGAAVATVPGGRVRDFAAVASYGVAYLLLAALLGLPTVALLRTRLGRR